MLFFVYFVIDPGASGIKYSTTILLYRVYCVKVSFAKCVLNISNGNYFCKYGKSAEWY
jgi:hypothetical protein